jgi:dihydrofolate reductase
MYGSPMLMRSLLQHGLIDQLDLMVCPIVIGMGQRLFGDGGPSVWSSTNSLTRTKPSIRRNSIPP